MVAWLLNLGVTNMGATDPNLETLLNVLRTISDYESLTVDKLPTTFTITLPDSTVVTYERSTP